MKRFVLVLLLACSGSETPEPEPVVEAPATPPEGLLVTIDFGAGALQALGEAVESPMLRALLPASPSELVARVHDGPRSVDEQTPVRVAMVGEWTDPRIAIGFGSNGRRAVVASDPDLESEARAWVSSSVDVEAIEARFEDAAMSSLRRLLDRALDEQVQSARAGIGLEAARHDEPPAYGDPTAIVMWVAQRLASYVAFVPDLRDARIAVELDPLVVRGSFRAEEDSPAGAALAEEEVEDVPPIPGGSALAWWRTAPRPGWAQLLETSAGARLSERDRELVRELGALPSQGVLVAAGRDTTPFALVRSPHAPPNLEPFLGIGHVRTLLGLFRCDRVRRISLGARLCAEGPFVHLATNDEGHVLSVADRAAFEPSPASADARRVVPPRASGLLLLDAGRIAPASGLVRPTAPNAPARETPIALSWTAAGTAGTFELRFAPGSLAAVADASMAATDP